MGLTDLIYWHWFIAFLLLLILETIVPGAIFLWISIAAAMTGIIKFFVPSFGFAGQILFFAISSVVSVVGWRFYQHQRPASEPTVSLNLRGTELIGRRIKLQSPITNGQGKLQINGSLWTIEGADCPASTTVEIIGIQGTLLKVKEFSEIVKS